MRTPRQYLSERFPSLTLLDSLAATFFLVLLITATWPASGLIRELVFVTAIPGSIGAIVWALTLWSKARVLIGRLKLRYKSVRRYAGIVALACLPFLLLQQASLYLRGPNILREPIPDVTGLTEPYPKLGHWEMRTVVAIAHLEGDDGRKIEAQLHDALASLDPRLHVTPVILNKMIAVSGRPLGIAHLEALNAVTDLRVNALIWGEVRSPRHPTGAIYLTAFGNNPQFSGVYLPADFKLPDLAPDDFCDVVRLVAATQTAALRSQRMFEFGDALEPLIRQTRSIADDPRRSAAWNADARARVNFVLGFASTTSGIELKSEDSLHAAVTYFQRIQPDWTRESDPVDWAEAQLNLGVALSQLSILNGQVEPVQAAITAVKNALSVYQEKSDTVDAATAQLALGRAYQQMSANEAGPENLRQAAEYSRAAVKGFDAKFYPMSWAVAQTTLGTVLTSLADRTGKTDEYDDAIAAFDKSLLVYSKQSDPMLWARAQIQRGEAIELRGQARSDVKDLKKAVAASRQVLDGFPRAQDVAQWRDAQITLGNELLSLNEVEHNPSYPRQAANAYRAGLEVTSRDHDPIAWADQKDGLGGALEQLGISTNESWYFEQAIQNLNEALEVLKPDRNPLQWARTKSDLGDALCGLGLRGPGVRYLKEAVDSYNQALTILTKDKLPEDWQKTSNNREVALEALHQRGS